MQVADLFAKLGLRPDKKEWAAGDKLISGIKKAVAGLAISVGAVKLAGLIKDTSSAANTALEASQRLGITTEAVGELSFAAGMSASSFEELEAGLRRFSSGLSDAARTGKGPMADTLKILGLRAKDLTKESLDQNLEQIANKFKAMPDGAKKSALAVDLFGKAGTRLIPLLNEGQAGIVALRNEAHELGLTFDKDTAKAFDNFDDDLDRVKGSLTGLRNQVVVAILPTLQAMVTGLIGWVKANRAVIASGIATAVQVLISLFKVLATAVGFVVDVFRFLAEHTDLAKALLLALGTVLTAVAAQAVVAWLAVAGPIIAVIAVLTGVYLAAVKVIKHWPKITAAVRAAMSKIVGAIKGAGRSIADFFVGLGKAIAAPFIAAFRFIEGVVDTIVAKIKAAIDFAKRAANAVADFFGVGEAHPDSWDPARKAKADKRGATDPRSWDDFFKTESGFPATRGADGGGGVNATTSITVNAAPGQSPEQVGQAVRAQFDQHMARTLQHAAAGIGVK